jgi:hypothetical protein
MVVLNSKKYVLDLISVRAAAAYSLRRLYASYTGAAIRVRRSSDNAEIDIGFIREGLDVVTLLAFVGAGSGFITTWYDQSGNGRNATQTTAGAQPRIVNAGAIETTNGRPNLVVSGQQFMDSSLTVAQTVVDGVITTLSTVFQSAQGISGTLVNAQFQGGNAYNVHAPWVDGNTYFDVLGLSPRVAEPVTWDALSVGAFVRNGALANVYKNGVTVISTNNNPTTWTQVDQPLVLFALILNLVLNHMVGSVSEMIFFPSALSTADRQTLERNQGAYYSITVA